MNDPRNNERRRRPVRSFVLREGRMTAGQQRAFESLWPRWGIDYRPEPLDLRAVFGNDGPVFFEIGFGNGESLAEMARRDPGTNYLGAEVHRPGVGHLLLKLDEFGCTNVRVIRHDAVEVLQRMLPPASLDGVYLFFPDPWHKKRHNKRRILQAPLLERLAQVLKPGAILHAATDWADYAEHMLDTLSADGVRFENCAGPGNFMPRPDYRPLTRFERRGRRLGHEVRDLVFRRRT